MRFYFLIIFAIFLVFIGSKMIKLLVQGKLFDEGAFKAELRESGKTIWLGMRLFVILWLLYLLMLYFMRN